MIAQSDFVDMPSEEIVEDAKKNKLEKTFYLEAHAAGDVLTISIWMQISLIHNETRAKKDGIYWINRASETWGGIWNGKRSHAKFSNFLRMKKYGGDWRYGSVSVNASRKAKKIIRQFIGGEHKDIELEINEWQDRIGNRKLQESYQRMFQRIDTVMDTVTDMPDDWDDWIANTAFAQDRYIFFKTLKKEQMYACEVCGYMGQVQGKRFSHNEATVCPVCGAKVTAKGWNRQKYINSNHDVVIYQRTTEGRLIARKFWVKKEMRQTGGFWKPNLYVIENRRDILTSIGTCREPYIMATHTPTNIYRWLQGGIAHMDDWRVRRIVYEKNLMDVLGGLPQIGHVDLMELFEAGKGIEVAHENILKNLDGFDQIEYLQKAGFHAMAVDAAEIGKKFHLFNAAGTTAEEFLQLDRKHLEQLKRMDGGLAELAFIQEMYAEDEPLDDDSIRWCIRTGVSLRGMRLTLTHLTAQRMINYIRKQLASTKMTFRDWNQMYGDYLEMARKRGMDVTDDIVRKNPRMRYFHDKYVDEDIKKDIAKKGKEKERKYKKIKADARRNEEHFHFEKGGYVITAASCASDIVAEGKRQHHCVGAGETYFQKMNRRESFILFLRRTEEPETAYYTLEAKWNGHIEQAYGAYDRRPDWGTVEKLLRSFTSEIQERCAKEEEAEKMAKKTAYGSEAYNSLLVAAG